jgi:hypothetical protein
VDAYRLRDDFLSPAEASFFHVLRLVVGQQFVVCPKVRLADVFFVMRPQENRGAMNRIIAKHVDFLLLDPSTLKPVAGVELDDASHQRALAAERDEFKEGVFAAAGLPLVRVPVQRAYEVAQISALFAAVLTPPATAVSLPQSAPIMEPSEGSVSASPPACSKCGGPMVLRTATRGENRGEKFWGCTHYPRCRTMAPVGEPA